MLIIAHAGLLHVHTADLAPLLIGAVVFTVASLWAARRRAA